MNSLFNIQNNNIRSKISRNIVSFLYLILKHDNIKKFQLLLIKYNYKERMKEPIHISLMNSNLTDDLFNAIF